MPKYLDTSGTYPFQCDDCGHKFKKKIAGLEKDFKIACPACGVITHFDTKKARAGLRRAEKSIDDLAKTLRKLGKKL